MITFRYIFANLRSRFLPAMVTISPAGTLRFELATMPRKARKNTPLLPDAAAFPECRNFAFTA